MRVPTLAALTLATLVVSSGTALATEYPWCLIKGDHDGPGTWSCGYVSFEQCMASRTGTDMCNINPRYPSASPRKTRR